MKDGYFQRVARETPTQLWINNPTLTAPSTKRKNPAQFVQADLEFHFVVAKAAGNLLLSGFMTLIRNLMREWISLSLQAPRVAAAALHQHRKIFEAIRNG